MARSYGINVLHAVTGTFDNGQQVNYTTPGAKEIIHFSTYQRAGISERVVPAFSLLLNQEEIGRSEGLLAGQALLPK